MQVFVFGGRGFGRTLVRQALFVMWAMYALWWGVIR